MPNGSPGSGLNTIELASTSVREAFVLWQIFAMLMALFFVVLGLMILRRWVKRRHRKPTQTSRAMPDPWRESAERIDTSDQ